MKKKTLDYLKGNYLHDAVINYFHIDFKEKTIVFDAVVEECNVYDDEKIRIELFGIKFLKLDDSYDFKNDETILQFQIISQNEIKMYTTSDFWYKISFKKCVVYTDKE